MPTAGMPPECAGAPLRGRTGSPIFGVRAGTMPTMRGPLSHRDTDDAATGTNPISVCEPPLSTVFGVEVLIAGERIDEQFDERSYRRYQCPTE